MCVCVHLYTCPRIVVRYPIIFQKSLSATESSMQYRLTIKDSLTPVVVWICDNIEEEGMGAGFICQLPLERALMVTTTAVSLQGRDPTVYTVGYE